MSRSAKLDTSRSAYLRAIVDCLPDAVFIHSRDSRILDVNQQACDSLGYTREQLLSMTVRDIEREFRLNFRYLEQQLDAGKSAKLRGRHQRADGTQFDVEVRVQPLVVGDQRLTCAVVRPAKREPETVSLAEAQQLELTAFREVVQNASEGIAVIDHEGCYLMQNAAHRALLGYSDVDLYNKTPAIHLGPQAFEAIASELSRSGTYVGEHIARTKSGAELRLELSAFTVSQGEGRPPLFVGIKRDVTQRERDARAELDRRTHELEESLRQAQKMELIGRLAAGVAHDFNNLLTPILGYVDIELHRPDRSRSQIEESLREIAQAADRGRQLTNQLLAFGRKQVLDKRVLDLRGLLLDAQRMFRRLVSDAVTIEIDIGDDLHPVVADPTALEQVLMNLITNAHDAMHDGGSIRIEVRNLLVGEGHKLARALGESGSFVEIVVTDSGHGMSDATLEHLFEPFYTEKPNGTGLGLSIVHGIIRQHGGYIQVDSAPGEGSRFRVILPRAPSAEESTAGPRDSDPSREGETILVAEDQMQVRQLVQQVLESNGYRVLVGVDGSDAERVATEFEGTIDLLLTDVVMPNLNGRALYERLESKRPGLLVLFMTGYAGDGFDITSTANVLRKPFSATDLLQRVESVLASSRRS